MIVATVLSVKLILSSCYFPNYTCFPLVDIAAFVVYIVYMVDTIEIGKEKEQKKKSPVLKIRKIIEYCLIYNQWI